MASVGGSKDTLTINLYPMLDIFSILIVFLLMSYSTDPVSHDVSQGVELPESQTLVSLDEIPAITVSKTEIFVQDKKIANILNGDVEDKAKSQGAIYPLFEELKKLAEANKRLAGTRSDDPSQVGKTGTLTLEMDKGHKFVIMRRVMLSAQQAEFVTFKLMTNRINGS